MNDLDYYYRSNDGRVYEFENRNVARTWFAYANVQATKITSRDRRSFTYEPQKIGALPGSLIVLHRGTYYWLEDGGSPANVIARPFASREVIEGAFGRSWRKYLYNTSASVASAYQIGPTIEAPGELPSAVTLLKDYVTIRRTQTPKGN